MTPHVFQQTSNGTGTGVLSDDRAWLEAVRRQLMERKPLRQHRVITPRYTTLLGNGEEHQYKYMLLADYPLEDAVREHLVQLGGVDLASLQRGSRAPSPAGTGGAATLGRAAGPPPTRRGVPLSGRRPNAPAAATPQVDSTVWSRDLLRWLDREQDLVSRTLGGWRIPHAELRQLIQSGLLDRAEMLIQELNEQEPTLVVELYRYQLWVSHSRKDWRTLLDYYEAYGDQLGTGLFLTFVADAYLALDDPARAGRTLLPLLTSDLPSVDRAPAYALAARCHAALDETDLARTRLMQAWPRMSAQEQAQYQDLHTLLQETGPPTPVAPEPRHDPWEAVLPRLQARLDTEPVAAYYDLRPLVDQEDQVPPAVTHLLGRLAAKAGDYDTARTAYETLWACQDGLDDAVLDDMREHLIRDAVNRGAWADVTRFVQGWYGVRADPELLMQIGWAFEVERDTAQAEKFYRLALEGNAQYAPALRFLALLESRRYDETNNDAHVRQAHLHFTRLVSLPDNGLQPDDAVRWLLALQVLDMDHEAEEAIQHVLNGLTVYEYADWLDVFEAQVNLVQKNRRAPELIARASADHLLAAHQADKPSDELTQMVPLALQRITDPVHQVSYLEEAEAIQDPAVRHVVHTAAENLAIQELGRGTTLDQDLVRRLLLLTFSTGGEAAYWALKELYDAQVDAARRAGAPMDAPAQGDLLAGTRVALVGGHGHWQGQAEAELTRFYGAQTIRLVPPSWEANQDESILAARLRDCDLILVMWRCMKHSTSGIIRNLINRGVIKSNQVRPVPGTGGKGFVREAIKTIPPGTLFQDLPGQHRRC